LRGIFFYIFLLLSTAAFPQTTGGNAAYNFMNLPASPIVTAAGGVNISYRTSDVGISAGNPALLRPEMGTQLNLSFNSFLGEIKTYSLTGALHSEKLETTFAGHIHYLNYGPIAATDYAGNVNGEFRPVDYVVQGSFARRYLEKWRYGGTLKFINSSYQQYRSSAVAIDFGILFSDSAKGLCVSLVAKNMGAQVSNYAGQAEDLPFDLQIGVTKKLAKAPFGFSLTARQLHRFDLQYDDTAFNNDNRFASPSTINRFFNHLVIATHFYLGQNLEALVGYNHLRRQELSIPEAGNGLAGFSAGLHIKFNKLQILYARTSYQRGMNYNQIGVTVQLNKWGAFAN